jgi:D-Tyr-tRNAtyr deacylase
MNGTMRKSAITNQNSAGLGATVTGYLKYGIQYLLGVEEVKDDQEKLSPKARKSVKWNVKEDEEYQMKPRSSRRSIDIEEIKRR